MQEQFWDTVHPERDEDGNADLRIGAVELASNLIAGSLKAVPLTRGGINWVQYQDARVIGFDTGDLSDEKARARAEAMERKQPTGEDLQRAIDGTPKTFYVETEALLVRSTERIDELDQFHEEKYGEDYPSLGKLKSSIEDVRKVISSVLSEKRKTEPDETDMVFIARFPSHKRFFIHTPIGRRLPMYCTASGRAYLAALGEPDADVSA